MKKPEALRILFVGNSYTYYNNLPGLLEYFAKKSPAEMVLKTKMVVKGGANLKLHWDMGKALKAIRSNKYTHVVLQEQSRLGGTYENGILRVGDPEIFFDCARRFDAEIKKAGAKTVFFLTWARRDFPRNQSKLNAAYTTIAKKLKATVVPVGPVWQMVSKKKPEISLYDPDGSHPSPAGTYLIGCVFYGSLLGRSPIGLPYRTYESSEKTLSHPKMIDLAEKDARALQTIAWKAKQTSVKSGIMSK